jgi:hypothetical protein
LTWRRTLWSYGSEMKFRAAPFGRLTTVALGLAVVVSFVLPCLCLAEGPPSHRHCEGSEGGLRGADSSCCCGGALPAAAETTVKLIPTAPGVPTAVDALPVLFAVLSRVSAAPAGRAPAGPRALLVLRR